ncbi:hypothetical protein HJC23_009860 [Cyclotella cryptica]|uniref:Cyclin-like domain-containing protein n=1 Tax=Cyclotella cryptica TaxID=29204 RepID=A0ABD3QDA1_9STRA|eukprot:CCRYP_006971-RA/>CCRYP_006971-RA protein AED:0.05 eAED:0.04 QI:0/0/0/1/1/1/2/0/335
MDRPFDDIVFVNYFMDNHDDHFKTLLEVEIRYKLSQPVCIAYRKELDIAAGLSDRHNPNADWRYRIARWLLRASDELSLSRETALIALIYCDRFMSTRHINKRLLQVASITSLFVASKLYEKKPIKMAALISYTQNGFPQSEIISMETKILTSNNSFMYPPTAGTFLLVLLNGFAGPNDLVKLLIDNTQFLIELASCDFFFLPFRPSTIAMAAIRVAFEQDDLNMDSSYKTQIESHIDAVNAPSSEADKKDVEDCIQRLRTIFHQNQLLIVEIDSKRDAGENQSAKTATVSADTGRVTPSPTLEVDTVRDAKCAGDTDLHSGASNRKRRHEEIVL